MRVAILVLVVSVVTAGPVSAADLSTETGDSPLGGGAEATARARVALQELSPRERGNATIHLMVSPSGTPETDAAAETIEALWNAGNFEAAIQRLGRLEADGVAVSLGISWREPVPAGLKSAGVTPLTTQTSALRGVVDSDETTGNLFAAVTYSQSTGVDMTLSISKDGFGWRETYRGALTNNPGLVAFDMVVAGEYVYVAFASASYSTYPRLVRFSAATGAFDSDYDSELLAVLPQAPGPPYLATTDIVLESNAGSSGANVYVMLIQVADNSLRYFWDSASDGKSFTEASPAVGNAASGLDLHWNHLRSTSYFLFASYIGTDNNLYVLRRGTGGIGWEATILIEPDCSGPAKLTAISAYRDTVITTYEHDYGSDGIGCRYRISYDAGDGWALGGFLPQDPLGQYCRCDVTARGGLGTALTFHRYQPVPNEVLFNFRGGYSGGLWDAPVGLVPAGVSSCTAAVNWLAPIGTYGVVYVGPSPDRRPYFAMVGGHLIFADGFELGDTSQW